MQQPTVSTFNDETTEPKSHIQRGNPMKITTPHGTLEGESIEAILAK